MGFFDKLKSGLKKTKDSFLGTVDTILAGFGKIDEALFEELEDVLISSDFGVQTTEEILKKLRESVKTKKLTEASQIRSELQEIIAGLLDIGARGLDLDDVPAVITVIGVNGVGKTTSIGKIAHLYRNAGKKVLLAAGDTFRAAAGDQLAIWAERSGAELTGIVLTKLDGSSKGGIIVSICNELNIPVRLVGVGEGIEDMHPFSPEDYVRALFE